MSEQLFECLSCKAEIEVGAFLSGMGVFHAETRSATAKCPACGVALEFQVRSGNLELGYSYWAGAMHFEGLVTVHVPGIKVVGEGDARGVAVGGLVYRPRSQ